MRGYFARMKTLGEKLFLFQNFGGQLAVFHCHHPQPPERRRRRRRRLHRAQNSTTSCRYTLQMSSNPLIFSDFTNASPICRKIWLKVGATADFFVFRRTRFASLEQTDTPTQFYSQRSIQWCA